MFYSMDEVRDHLKDYLDRSCRVASGKQAIIDQNLYLLIIQCLEVSKIEYRLGVGWGTWSSVYPYPSENKGIEGWERRTYM